MTHGFVRALWGDNRNPMLAKVYADIERSLHENHHPEPIVTFAYGEHNRDFLRGVGVESTLFPMDCVQSAVPVNDFSWRKIKPEILRAESVYGVRFWVLKLRAIMAALELYDQVVWLDWDIEVLRPLPGDFWQERARGPTFQAGLRNLSRNHCPWRPCGGGQTPHGGVVYCRDAAILRRLIVLQHVMPLASDEELFGMHVEMEFGGWDEKSPDRWIAEGYELPNYRHRGQLFRPDGNTVLFHHGARRV